MHLLGQALNSLAPPTPDIMPPPTPDGGLWNISAWADLARALGPMGFIAVILLVFFFSFFAFTQWQAYKSRDKRDGEVLHTLRRMTKMWGYYLRRSERIQTAQFSLCRQVHSVGGSANVVDLREAGHAAADALKAIGGLVTATAKDATTQHKQELATSIATMHESLRNLPPSLPEMPRNGNGMMAQDVK